MTDLPPDRFETYVRRGFKWFLIMTGIFVGLLVVNHFVYWYWISPFKYSD
jgi:hypothetical protein